MIESDTLTLPPVKDLVGTLRRFGETGPVYEVLGAGAALPGGDGTMRVRVLETNEQFDYRLRDLLADPHEGRCSPSHSI